MRAMVYTAPLELEMQDVPEPAPAAGEVVVEVRAAGICGSELEGFRSRSPFRVPPLIMGHEFAGVRADTGERVAINPLTSCGACDLCLRGLANVCRRRALLGIQRAGGFAERVAVPESCLHPMPDGMTFEQGSLAEPLANGVHAMRLAQEHDQQPQRVGVIGAGMLGLAVGIVARRQGVRHVEICDTSADRLATAEAEGLTPAGGELDGEFDVVFDAVGSAVTRRASVERIRPGGSAVWIGLHGPEAGFDGLDLIRGERRVLGTFAYVDRDFRAALALAGELAPRWLEQRPLEDGVGTFRRLLGGPAAATKTVLVP
jgi:threonine dehydrogenase-like Zn-dependent dehydrogenase